MNKRHLDVDVVNNVVLGIHEVIIISGLNYLFTNRRIVAIIILMGDVIGDLKVFMQRICRGGGGQRRGGCCGGPNQR